MNIENFKSLIEPIRDLAASWDIDISDSLEHYLNELDRISFSSDANGEKVNFAEAALLIQGSAAVYGKKVEYLYQLVMESLDYLSSQATEQSKGKPVSKRGRTPAYDEERILFGEDPMLLLLDDLIETSEDINLKENDDSSPSRLSRRSSVGFFLSILKLF